MIIVNGKATLREIRDEYDFFEIIDLFEICAVELHNKQVKLKEAMKDGK